MKKFLEIGDLNGLFDKVLKIFAETEKRRKNLLEKQEKLEKLEEEQEKEAKENLDESDEEDENEYANDLEQDIEEIEEILVALADFIGILFKTHKSHTINIVEKLTKIVLPEFFKSSASTFELKMGIFIVDDMVEHLGQEFLSGIWKDLAAILIKYTDNETPEIRQAAVYGLGMFAMVTKIDFENYSGAFLEKLDNAINFKDEDEDEEEHGHAKDNAIAALGKVIIYQGKNIKNIEHWIQKWIDYLPLSFDEGESVGNHELLCNAIVGSSDLFLGGKNYSNLSQIIRILSTIYKTKHSNETVDNLAKKILQSLATNSATSEVFKIAVTNLEEKYHKKLQEILA